MVRDEVSQTMSRVAVVIPVRNGARWIGELLDSLGSQSRPPDEVVVVDDHSQDALAQTLRCHPLGSFARLLPLTDREGPSAARNLGVRATTATEILTVDADDVLDMRYVEVMSNELRNHSIVASRVDTLLLNPGHRSRSRAVAQRSGLNAGPPPWGYGGTLGFRREVFDAVSGFDETLRYCEDIVFCADAHSKGFDLAYAPEAILHYRFPESALSLYRQGKRYGQGAVAAVGRVAGSPPVPPSISTIARTGARPDPGYWRRALFLLGRRRGINSAIASSKR